MSRLFKLLGELFPRHGDCFAGFLFQAEPLARDAYHIFRDARGCRSGWKSLPWRLPLRGTEAPSRLFPPSQATLPPRACARRTGLRAVGGGHGKEAHRVLLELLRELQGLELERRRPLGQGLYPVCTMVSPAMLAAPISAIPRIVAPVLSNSFPLMVIDVLLQYLPVARAVRRTRASTGASGHGRQHGAAGTKREYFAAAPGPFGHAPW